MFDVGPGELIFLLVLALVVFGPKRLPEIGRQLGKGLRELKRASNEMLAAIQEPIDRDLKPQASVLRELRDGVVSDAQDGNPKEGEK